MIPDFSKIMTWLNGENSKDFLKFLTSNSNAHKIMAAAIKKGFPVVKKYYYMLTFTTDPKKWPNDKNVIPLVDQYIKNIPERPALQITKYSYCRELHLNGRMHWHVILISLTSIPLNRFTHYTSVYGIVLRSKNKTDNWSTMLHYIEKDGDIHHLI